MSNTTSFVVPDGTHDKLEPYLHSLLRNGGTSRSKVKKMIQAGDVQLNEAVEKKCGRKIRGGDVIDVHVEKVADKESRVPLAEGDVPFEVIHEDQHVVVVNKPCGVIVHPSIDSGQGFTGSLVNGLLHRYPGSLATAHDTQGVRPGIVHRLDRDTSGLLCVARSDSAFRNLQKQFMEHTSERTYVALVKGKFSGGCEGGTVDAPIGRHPNRGTSRTVVAVGQGRSAVTHWKILKRFQEGTLVECKLETGRTHQIRVHMKHIKHPLFCDEVYATGGTREQALVERKLRKLINDGGQYLHAIELSFNHPDSGQRKRRMLTLNPKTGTRMPHIRRSALSPFEEILMSDNGNCWPTHY